MLYLVSVNRLPLIKQVSARYSIPLGKYIKKKQIYLLFYLIISDFNLTRLSIEPNVRIYSLTTPYKFCFLKVATEKSVLFHPFDLIGENFSSI